MRPLERILNVLQRLEVRPYHRRLLIGVKVPRLGLDLAVGLSVPLGVLFGIVFLLVLVWRDVELLES